MFVLAVQNVPDSTFILVLILVLNIHAHKRTAQDCITTNCSPDGSVLLRLKWKCDLQFWLLKYFIVQNENTQHNYWYIICWYRNIMIIIIFVYDLIWLFVIKTKYMYVFFGNICVIITSLIFMEYLNGFREYYVNQYLK